MRPALACAFLAALLLSGCASTGGLRPTATPLQPSGLHSARSLAGVPQSGSAWPKPGWWKQLGDKQLDQLVAEALADNPDMTLVNARVEAALAAANAVDAERKPTLNGGASVSGARVPPLLPPIANGHYGTLRYGYLSFKWDLDIWGGKRAAFEAAVGNARATEVDAQAAQLKLSADVVQAYFNLAGAYVLQDLARADLQRAADFQKLTRKLVDSGIENKLPLDQIESETATDRAQVKVADNEVRQAGLVLAALLGKGPDRALRIRHPVLPAIPALAIPSDLPADLLGRRPDVVAARWRVEASSRDIKSARTKFLPNLDISSLAGLIAPSAMNLFALPNRFYEIAPAVSVPIFEGGALRANLARKDAARDIAVAQYNGTLVQAIHQVASRVDAMHALNSELGDTEAAKNHASQAYQLSLLRFRAGIGSFLEALTLRQELIRTERRLALLQLQRSNAWAQLNEALGGGFQPSDDAPAIAATSEHASESRVHP